MTTADVWDGLDVPDKIAGRYGPHYGYQNRYLLRLPGEPKAKLRRRVTRIAKAIEDQSNLKPWHTAKGITGAFSDVKVRSAWSALLSEHPDPWETSKDELTGDDGLIEAAVAAGGGNDRREQGTAFHRIMHVFNRGDIPQVDGEFAAALETYRLRLAAENLTPIKTLTEMSVWIERYEAVGTFDAIMTQRIKSARLHRMVDLKTGGQTWKPDVDWKTKKFKGWRDAHVDSDLSEAMQLAIYSDDTAQIIIWPEDPFDECELIPLPDLDRTIGVIIHLPVGENVCTARYLDLEAGRAAVRLAVDVIETRKMRPLIRKSGPADPPIPGCEQPAADTLDFRREWVAQRVRALPQGAVDVLARMVADHGSLPRVSVSSDAHLDDWATLLDCVEAEFEQPFGAKDPSKPTNRKRKQ